MGVVAVLNDNQPVGGGGGVLHDTLAREGGGGGSVDVLKDNQPGRKAS